MSASTMPCRGVRGSINPNNRCLVLFVYATANANVVFSGSVSRPNKRYALTFRTIGVLLRSNNTILDCVITAVATYPYCTASCVVTCLIEIRRALHNKRVIRGIISNTNPIIPRIDKQHMVDAVALDAEVDVISAVIKHNFAVYSRHCKKSG